MVSKPELQLLSLTQAEIASIYAALCLAEDDPKQHQAMIQDVLTDQQASEINISHLKNKINHRQVQVLPRFGIVLQHQQIHDIVGADAGQVMLLSKNNQCYQFLNHLEINRRQWPPVVKAYQEHLKLPD